MVQRILEIRYLGIILFTERWNLKAVNEVSLSVEPAASFIGDFRGKHLIVINREPTPADEQAELVIRADVAEVLSFGGRS